MKLPANQSNPLEKLSIRQIRFLTEYAKTGNITKSWMAIYKTKTPHQAYESARQFLKKHQDARKTFFEMHGIDDMAIATALKDGFEAKKPVVIKGELYEMDDPYARIKAAEVANKLLGNEETKTIGNQVNVQIIADKGTFKVEDNQ